MLKYHHDNMARCAQKVGQSRLTTLSHFLCYPCLPSTKTVVVIQSPITFDLQDALTGTSIILSLHHVNSRTSFQRATFENGPRDNTDRWFFHYHELYTLLR